MFLFPIFKDSSNSILLMWYEKKSGIIFSTESSCTVFDCRFGWQFKIHLQEENINYFILLLHSFIIQCLQLSKKSIKIRYLFEETAMMYLPCI